MLLQIIGYRPGAGVPVSVDCKVQVLLSVLSSGGYKAKCVLLMDLSTICPHSIPKHSQAPVLPVSGHSWRPVCREGQRSPVSCFPCCSCSLMGTTTLSPWGSLGAWVPGPSWSCSSVGRCRNCSHPSPAALQHPQSQEHPASQQQWGQGRAPTAQAAAGSHPQRAKAQQGINRQQTVTLPVPP